jgi:ribonuclease P protein component
MLSKTHRLSKNGSFNYVYRNGTPVYGKDLTLLFVPSSSDSVRVGFSVNNKIGKAVVRNKLKRRLRAIVGKYIPLMRGSQCVFVAKKGLTELSFDELADLVAKLILKAGLINETEKEEERV